MGIIKHVLAVEDRQSAERERHHFDVDFIEQHTHGFDAMIEKGRATSWDEIEAGSGLSRADPETAGQVYCDALKVIGIYDMGVTQYVHGSQAIGMLVNLLLLRGHTGVEGAVILPVRGHSNVQGQRRVGISEKPELAADPRAEVGKAEKEAREDQRPDQPSLDF